MYAYSRTAKDGNVLLDAAFEFNRYPTQCVGQRRMQDNVLCRKSLENVEAFKAGMVIRQVN